MQAKHLIEWVFRNEKDIREKVDEMHSIEAISASGTSCGGGGNNISRPVENIAIRRVDELQKVSFPKGPNGGSINLSWPERWLKMVDATKKYFANTIEGDIIKECYGKDVTNADFIEAHKLSRTSFFDMKKSILQVASGAALVQGLNIGK